MGRNLPTDKFKMRILMTAVCLTMIRLSGAQVQTTTPPLFTVACTNKTTATVTVNGHGSTLTSMESPCRLINNTVGSNIIYTLGPSCLPNKKLELEQKMVNHKNLINEFRQEIQVECVDDTDGILALVESNSFRLSSWTLAPAKVKPTLHPMPSPSLNLIVMPTAPSYVDTAADIVSRSLASATYGDTLYLTILNDVAQDALILPRNCSAMTATRTESTVIWDIRDGPQCIKHPDVVKSAFQRGKTSDAKPFSYIRVQAFSYADQEFTNIMFACDVRVCATDVAGLCRMEKVKMDACSFAPAAAPVRRRREMNIARSSHGRTHHVTTTLHVVNDVMDPGTGGSTTIKYTLPWLLVSLLAKAMV